MCPFSVTPLRTSSLIFNFMVRSSFRRSVRGQRSLPSPSYQRTVSVKLRLAPCCLPVQETFPFCPSIPLQLPFYDPLFLRSAERPPFHITKRLQKFPIPFSRSGPPRKRTPTDWVTPQLSLPRFHLRSSMCLMQLLPGHDSLSSLGFLIPPFNFHYRLSPFLLRYHSRRFPILFSFNCSGIEFSDRSAVFLFIFAVIRLASADSPVVGGTGLGLLTT